MPTPTEATPARLLMENPGGRVIFTHKDHSTPGGVYGDAACADCHHELKIAPGAVTEKETPPVMRCTACHGSADDPNFIASHQEYYRVKGGDASCVTCHHGRVDGFSEKWNHKDHWDYAGDCETCHHERPYEYKPGKFMNIRPQKCANCHTPKSNPLSATTRKDAGHQRCKSCHSDWFTEGSTGCATCHSLKSSAKELAEGVFDKTYPSCGSCHKPIPGAMDAFHGNCMSCHDKAGKGPGAKAPCAQCHMP